ncbi:uncharacterized protein [Diadema setosum]|uniref:uncharacterized protein n=1 Tax=Diadema setosum TaxID=31175 RepID=UPI003B3AAFB2
MMKVIDAVGALAEELEDGEIEEEEGQISVFTEEETGLVVDDGEVLPKLKASEKNKRDKFVDRTNDNDISSLRTLLQSNNKVKEIVPSRSHLHADNREYKAKGIGSRNSYSHSRVKSPRSGAISPRGRARERSRTPSVSSGGNASWVQRRAREVAKRARRRKSPSPTRKSSKTRNTSTRRRSRSPVVRYQRSYRPPIQYEPELEEYEKLLKQHRSVQHKIKEEQRRLSGCQENSSHQQDTSQQRAQPLTRGRSKDNSGRSSERLTEGDDIKKAKEEDDNEDEEMLLLQLRKDALASLAKEEKGKENQMAAETENAREPAPVPQGEAVQEDDHIKTDTRKEEGTASSKDDLEDTFIAVAEIPDAKPSEGQFDNYEEVEMEVELEEECEKSIEKHSIETAESSVKVEKSEVLPSSSAASPSQPAENRAGDDDADENLLRAQLLKGMLTKRAAKAQIERASTNKKNTQTKPSAQTPLSTPNSTPPHVSRSSSPVITSTRQQQQQQQSSSLNGQKAKHLKPLTIPCHQPVVINLGEDSDESEDETPTDSAPFMGQLDSFLKEFRRSSSKQVADQSKQTTQNIKHGPKQLASTSRSSLQTQEGSKKLPARHRQDQQHLRQGVARQEHHRVDPSNAVKKEMPLDIEKSQHLYATMPGERPRAVKECVRSSEQDTPTGNEVVKSKMQVTVTQGGTQERTVSRSLDGVNTHPRRIGMEISRENRDPNAVVRVDRDVEEKKLAGSSEGTFVLQKREVKMEVDAASRKRKEQSRRQAAEVEKKRVQFRLMLKKDRGLIMNQDQQITRRRKNVQQAKMQIEHLKEQIIAAEKIITMNQAQISKHVRQKSFFEEQFKNHLAHDEQARWQLAKLTGVSIGDIERSEFSSFLTRPQSAVTAHLTSGKRKIELGGPSSMEAKKAKKAGETAELKRLKELERTLAERITKFRENEAKKAVAVITPKSVVPEDKVRLVRRQPATKPSSKIYSKDVIKLSADTPPNTDSEGEGSRTDTPNTKDQQLMRKSWLDRNPSRTPNLKVISRKVPISPSISDLGNLKAKFRSEGQRPGGKIAKASPGSVANDLLEWVESSEESKEKTSSLTVDKDDGTSAFKGMHSLEKRELEEIKRQQALAEKKGPDFSAPDYDSMNSESAFPGYGLNADWCKDTTAGGEDDESSASRKGDVVEATFASQDLVTYRSPLMCFKSFRLSPLFRNYAGLSVQSTTFTNKLDTRRCLCQYELNGTCNDDDCVWQHERDYTMSSREVITDLLSYKDLEKGESRAKGLPSPVRHKQAATEEDKLTACIENVLNGNSKGVVARLTACPRKWRPRPRPRSQRLSSSDEDASSGFLPLCPPKFPHSSGPEATTSSSGDSEVDPRWRAQETRAEGSQGSGVRDLENAVLEEPHSVHLWLKLARGLKQESCMDRTLNALSRGLEHNSDSSLLWIEYLTVYQGCADRKDYLEMCMKATELAPCYQTWWKLLEAEETVQSKLEVCDKILQYLKTTSNAPNVVDAENTRTCDSKVSQDSGRSSGDDSVGTTGDTKYSAIMESNIRNKIGSSDTSTSSVSNSKATENSCEDSCDNDENQDVGGREPVDNTSTVEKRKTNADCQAKSQNDVKTIHSDRPTNVSCQELSHQCLEILLYRAQVQLMAGQGSKASDDLLTFLQASSTREEQKCVPVPLLSVPDLCVAWMSLIHIHMSCSLPPSLFDPAAKKPTQIVRKDCIQLPWRSDCSTAVIETIRTHLSMACQAITTHSAAHGQSPIGNTELCLYFAQIEMEEHFGNCESMVSVYNLERRAHTKEEDRIALFARCLGGLFKTSAKKEFLDKFISQGVKEFPYSCRIHYLQAQLCVHFNEDDFLAPLRCCISGFYQIPALEAQRLPEEYFLDLYRHKLKQSLPSDFAAPPLSPEAPPLLDETNRVYLWLNYIMLTHYTLGEKLACDAFESALVCICGQKKLELIWLEYLKYSAKGSGGSSHVQSKHLGKLLDRCLATVPTLLPVPFSHEAGRYWSDFSFHNQAISVYLKSVPETEKIEAYDRLLLQMPDNVILAFRACQYAVKSGFPQFSLQIAYSMLRRCPSCIVFWKIVISLALQSQHSKEVPPLYETAVLFHPLDATLWKQYIAFEIVHGNDQKKLWNLLQQCRSLGLHQSSILSVSREKH